MTDFQKTAQAFTLAILVALSSPLHAEFSNDPNDNLFYDAEQYSQVGAQDDVSREEEKEGRHSESSETGADSKDKDTDGPSKSTGMRSPFNSFGKEFNADSPSSVERRDRDSAANRPTTPRNYAEPVVNNQETGFQEALSYFVGAQNVREVGEQPEAEFSNDFFFGPFRDESSL